MKGKLIPITLAALLLSISISGCGKSAENITAMNTPGSTTSEKTGSPEITKSDKAETQPVEETTAEEPAEIPTEETDDPHAGYVKETYQDPGEFIFGIERLVRESATVEEMYQAVEKFDTEGRIDKILISFDGKPVTEGRLVQGLSFEVYYDNEESWFMFQY